MQFFFNIKFVLIIAQAPKPGYVGVEIYTETIEGMFPLSRYALQPLTLYTVVLHFF